MEYLHAVKERFWLLPWAEIIAVLLVTYSLTILTVTLYLHRIKTHGAGRFHPALVHFFRFWSWCTTGLVEREWIAVHRYHHAKVETKDDPHSPVVHGLWTVLRNGLELYRRYAKNTKIVLHYGKGAADDWLERNIYNNQKMVRIWPLHLRIKWFGFVLFWVSLMTIFSAVTGSVVQGIAIGVMVSAIQMTIIPLLAAGVINGVGHHSGYRNFDTPDNSRNIAPWGILVGGEELHNNHHQFPRSPKFSVRTWEFDIGWCFLLLFEAIGLAKLRRDKIGTYQ